ncbi:prophage MuSo2, virion morphogenesis protein, putative [Fulvimarina pelagi HTCC2506]|uniref:Prophage MuSo2, virion morphogenesis protein, putative n=1 Tax=Fulvimarina pelagi HTCC2506 TaxID=314231 RepID=Q0FYZ7_9HYPH|nr:phage virion morphogenesis protein [Fulvimarina pelagi]EAU40161.1 prophage MuSo2, virion morphogenesis protein, putative [Fulvimarina pelagi HTCC2506]
MNGIRITVTAEDFDTAIARLKPLLDPDFGELTASIAALGESQTRRRIDTEKTAPDGTPWPANRAGTPILKQTGRNLLDSVASTSSETSAEWGATWEHAHVHQEGAVIGPKTAKALVFRGANGTVFARKVTIPARPFVGLSDENRAEMDDLITDFFSGLFDDKAWSAR